MLVIEDILVSDDILEEQFLCKLDACKGACCYDGDYGAPLEKEELDVIHRILPVIMPYLDQVSKDKIKEAGISSRFGKDQFLGTQLHEDGRCVFMVRDTKGIAKCTFEQAYLDGKTHFKKPVSCHLYPIRVEKNENSGFEAMNYNRWDICNAACKSGKENKLPLFRFLKEAIIRKYDLEFYNALEDAYINKYNSEDEA